MERFKSWRSYLLIAVCVVVNIVGRTIATKLQPPFWLDTVGTIIAAIQLGPLGGGITGAFTNILLSYDSVPDLLYIIVSVAIGVSVGILYPKDKRFDAFGIVATAVLAGLISVVLSTPLNIIFHDGAVRNIWGDNLIIMLSQSLNVPWMCTFFGQAFVDIPDKALCSFIAVSVLGFHKYIKTKNNEKKNNTAVMIFLIIAAGSVMSFGTAISAAAKSNADFSSEYAAISYDTEDGLASGEINAVAQTPDGYIWAGTYSGLYRYDGHKFENAELDERISNVMQLYVDSKGNLWIGTNDSGIACYNPETGEKVFYSAENGLSSNSIRAICEDDEGNIYVGTVTQLCVISHDGQVKEYENTELYGVRTMDMYDGIINGVTNGGEVFFIKNGNTINVSSMEDDNNVYYAAVAAGRNGEYLVGTSAGYALRVRVSDDGKMETIKQIQTGETSYFNKILYSEENEGFFFCCENGLGFIDNENHVTDLSQEEFNSSVGDVIIDYQGNIWFASNKQGILRFSHNPFEDIFAKAQIASDVVNALLIKDDILYIGMDRGLEAINLTSFAKVDFNNSNMFEGVRVRHLMEDSKGNLWVSTYGQDGLIELKSDDSVMSYNESTAGTVGGRFRLAMELSDGTILAVSSTGLNYIKDGKVTKTLSEADGLTTQILSMVQESDGKVVAGSDGDGVFIIENGEITDRINEEDGLESPVVLKVVPCSEGYIFVTSNALYHYSDGLASRLNAFPYSNNYDVYISDAGEAWVSSSAGIYVVNEKDLLENKEYSYTLLNRTRGFYTSLTANAHNVINSEDLYLCCTDGVRRISTTSYNSFDNDYNIRISRLTAADEVVSETDGIYRIPAVQGRIEFDVAVLNFTLSNPFLKIFLEGAQDDGITCFQNEMQSLVYTNLPYGNYKLHVQVINPADMSVIREEEFPVIKDSQLYERNYFKIYLLFVIVMFIFFIGWIIERIRRGMTNMKTWQKEATIDPMTGLLNKAASKRELTALCKTKKGILMMIDLDSFKLVNDLYGHDMGDRILIRFADIIRSCIRENDLAGRMGGDEFIAFIQGTSEESAVAEKAYVLNKEIVKSAKEFMGDDMTIPLGASIGAVVVPDQGTEYDKLFGYADKALYNVKQNGKHGYAMYRKSGGRITGDEDNQNIGIAGIRKILGERNEGKGAYKVDFDKLQAIYRTFVRLSKRVDARVWIVQFMVNPPEGQELSPDVVEQFYEILAGTLRTNDVVALNGKSQVLAIMTDIEPSNGAAPIERILKRWNDAPGHDGYDVTYETEAL